MSDAKIPRAAARAQARRYPGGWVCEIGRGLDLAGRIPPAAMVG